MRKLRLRVEWCAWSHRVILHRGLMNQVHCPGWLNSRLNLERNSPVFVFYISLLTLFSLIMTLWTHFRTVFNITGPIPLDNRENRFSPSHHQTTVDPVKLKPEKETLEPGDQIRYHRVMRHVGYRLSLRWCGEWDWAGPHDTWKLRSDRKWWSKCVVALKIVAGECQVIQVKR